MTTITLDLPDELATRIEPQRGRLASLLARALKAESPQAASQALTVEATHPVYQEMLDFLATRPSPQQIIEFKISARSQERLEELLEKNREEVLSDEEIAELDVYELVHHSVIRLKAQARLTLP